MARLVEPTALARGMGQGQEHTPERQLERCSCEGCVEKRRAILGEGMSDDIVEPFAREEPRQRQAAHRQYETGIEELEDAVEPGRAEVNLRRCRAAITRTVRAATREACGHRHHVDARAKVGLVSKPCGHHPAHQHSPGATSKRAPLLPLHGTRCLADEEDPLPRPAAEHRCGSGQETRINASRAASMRLLQCLERSLPALVTGRRPPAYHQHAARRFALEIITLVHRTCSGNGMSDDPRATHGNPANPRRNASAPGWWSQLERADLPPDGETARQFQQKPFARLARERYSLDSIELPPRVASRWRVWMINLAIVAITGIVVLIGVGATTPRTVIAAALVFGLPITLAALVTTIIARRAG